MAICGELALEEAMKLSQEKPRNERTNERTNELTNEWMNGMSYFNLCDNENSDVTTEY